MHESPRLLFAFLLCTLFLDSVAEPSLSLNGQRVNPGFLENKNGIEQAQAGNLKQAETLLREAINKEPDNADYWNNLGKVQSELGMLVEARQSFDHALSLQPSNAFAKQNIDALQDVLRRLPEKGRITQKNGYKRPDGVVVPEDKIFMDANGNLNMDGMVVPPSQFGSGDGTRATLSRFRQRRDQPPQAQQAAAAAPSHPKAAPGAATARKLSDKTDL